MTLEVPPWWPMKCWKNFAIWNLQDYWKTHFQSKKHWKHVLLWDTFLVDNVLRIALRQLQWNMSYWNGKDGKLSFQTQLKITFLPQNNSSKKCLKKSLQITRYIWTTHLSSRLAKYKKILCRSSQPEFTYSTSLMDTLEKGEK